MKKQLGLIALASLFAAPAFAAPETYLVDPNHTYPRFEYNHFGYSNQIQRFNKTSGTIVFDRAAKTGSVDIVIDAPLGRYRLCAVQRAPPGRRLLRYREAPDHHLQVHRRQV
jgi:hypothetical protein